MYLNAFNTIIVDGNECVEIKTNGKYSLGVIVDKESWFNYLCNHSWTAIYRSNRYDVKASVNKQSIAIWRMIIEHEFEELDYWGSTIDHINNNPLDNRIKNLRIFNTSLLNSTNSNSKYKENDMQFIHKQYNKQKDGRRIIYAYKVHYNLNGTTFYKNFSRREYGDNFLEQAKRYRDNQVYAAREEIIEKMIKKCRDIEFERGLKNKLHAGEVEDVKRILAKYEVT